ncbi:hypothetical protein ACFE04_000852 [Oxalis oulophora]
MLTLQTAMNNDQNHDDHDHDYDDEPIRDIHALTPPRPPSLPPPPGRRLWDRSSSSLLSVSSESSENFTTMSREFNALVIAGSTVDHHDGDTHEVPNNNNQLSRIGEDDHDFPIEETNPLAIVPDTNPIQDHGRHIVGSSGGGHSGVEAPSVQRVKKEEVESKISAWQNAKIAKVNNRFKREDAIIHGWESEQVQKASSWMKKVERKLEEKRARALEKMQNDIAKAHRKAEERRASAEAKRGTKVARVLEISNLMKAVGRAPVKRSFF